MTATVGLHQEAREPKRNSRSDLESDRSSDAAHAPWGGPTKALRLRVRPGHFGLVAGRASGPAHDFRSESAAGGGGGDAGDVLSTC